MKKTWRTLLAALMLCAALGTPVYAQQEAETETAGATLKQEMQEEMESAGDPSGEVIETPVIEGTTAKGQAAGWVEDSSGWWYVDEDGTVPKTAWRKINGSWYYFNGSGYWVEDNSYEEGTLKGIDVSYYQGDIDWQAVKEDGVEFAFIRIGRSSRVLDKKYEEYIEGANTVGIPVGVYYYSKAKSEGEAILDAQFVIEHLKGHTVSYPVVVDVEDPSIQNLGKAKVASITKAFCDEIRSAGYTPMFYANENWCRNYIDLGQLEDVERWIARYNYHWADDLPRNIWQCSSKGRINGISGDVDIDFGYTDYTKIITPRTQPVPGYVPRSGEWITNGTGKWYSYFNGGYPANTWEKIDGTWYWFDARGYMKTGWVNPDGSWYWLGYDGKMRTGWVSVGGIWYYLNASGRMVGNCWVGDYFLKANGEMAQNEWVDHRKYYVDDSGKWVRDMKPGTGVWKKDGRGWWFVDEDGNYPKKSWKRISGAWYWFDAEGYMYTGWLQLGSTWYYLKPDGSMATGTIYVGKQRYRFNSTGEWLGY